MKNTLIVFLIMMFMHGLANAEDMYVLKRLKNLMEHIEEF